jgi:hypothetical protein
MLYIEAPNYGGYPHTRKALFLAGGITGCPDWQNDVVRALNDTNLVLLNPRRKNFDVSDKSATDIQIRWEYKHLQLADAVLFWFPCETLCPITLFELGAQSKSNKPLFIGTHPNYQRQRDVYVQMGLARPELFVSNSFADIISMARQWAID